MSALTLGCPSPDDAPSATFGIVGGTWGADGWSEGSDDAGMADDGAVMTGTGGEDVDSETGAVDETGAAEPADVPPPEVPGVCVGLDASGYVATTYGREGTSDTPACNPEPAGCGGDIEGTWVIADSCGLEAIENPLAGICPGSQFELTPIVHGGTLTFEPDGTFIRNEAVNALMSFDFDAASCFGLSCGDMELPFTLDFGPTVCHDTFGGWCNCLTTTASKATDAGEYEVVDGRLKLHVGGEVHTLEMCVSPDGSLQTWEGVGEEVVTEQGCFDAAGCEGWLGDSYDSYECVPVDDLGDDE
ncbi:MAG: hypothetical protein AAF799_34185 [Myxococcota bacterium]